ncbi:YIEGIA family protein [Virgibacillus soli]|uniref:YIEGIA family protein n=1 Tax=Paracerasibacillus soli TaxID=480284 RepID=UPI0035E74B90
MFKILAEPIYVGVMIGLIFGIISRVIMLRTDYRQYPTYPHGKIIHLSLGIIAAGLGAIVIPALLAKEYTAVTFLALAAQQFREVRNMERETLKNIDENELVPRGAMYIEGIAMVFEGRNYLVIFSALIASMFTILFAWYWGVIAGILSLFVAKFFRSGKSISHIAEVELGEVSINGPNLFVDHIQMMNIGLQQNKQIIQKHGVGLLIKPKNKNAKVTISSPGQRQAIIHNLSTIMGVYRDSDEPALVPMAKIDLDSGNVAVFILPREKNPDQIIQVVKGAPLLESSVRLPSESKRKGGR